MGYITIPYKKQWVCVTKLLLVDPNCLGSNEESFLKIKSLKVPAEKPDILVQLSNSKPGQRRRDGSQTHLAMCKLYLCLLQRLYHPSLSVQLDPNPTDSTPPWAKSPHLYLPQFWPIWQFLVPAKESGQLDLGQEIY